MGYEEGKHALATIVYRKTTLARRPILDIWIAKDIDAHIEAQKPTEPMPLSTLIETLTQQWTRIKLDKVPYVIFRGHWLRYEALRIKHIGKDTRLHLPSKLQKNCLSLGKSRG
ncbi:hypothetical protein LZ31DRAFT_550265 [Colletotrichum somersetense]|nr:hypothetical protein LZ31DRAFT_550265 [Colletotrichum somersetense]